MRLEYVKKPVDWALASSAVLIMALLVICVVWQVFSRYVLNAPSTFTDELARFAMIWVGLLGAAYTAGAQRHLSIDLFTHRLTGRLRQANVVVVNLLVMAFAAGPMVWGGWRLVARVAATGQVSPAMQLPMSYVYLVLPVSGGIIIYYSLLFILDALLSQRQPGQAPSALLEEKI
jgi:TRAP-type C4-dicarboxylate transport system permease small subunit